MSRSLLRVKSALIGKGMTSEVLEMPAATRTADLLRATGARPAAFTA